MTSFHVLSDKGDHRLNGHVQHYDVRHNEADASGRLPNGVNGVDDGVPQPKGNDDTEQVNGDRLQRIGQGVEEPDQRNRHNVLQVVAVSPFK